MCLYYMDFQGITSVLGIMTFGYFIGRLIEFSIIKFNKENKNNEKGKDKKS